MSCNDHDIIWLRNGVRRRTVVCMAGAVDVPGSASRYADDIGMSSSKSRLMPLARGVRRRARFQTKGESYRTPNAAEAVIHDSLKCV